MHAGIALDADLEEDGKCIQFARGAIILLHTDLVGTPPRSGPPAGIVMAFVPPICARRPANSVRWEPGGVHEHAKQHVAHSDQSPGHASASVL
jgi:hypothetical protein